jgi:hypothetical protein
MDDDKQQQGPSVELSLDIAEWGDNPGAAYEDGERLDLGEHGTQDPAAPLTQLYSAIAQLRDSRNRLEVR